MKTPKRFKFSHMRCEFCQCVSSVDNEDNENGWFSCPYCGKVSKFKDEGFAHVSLYARWKRKNREARLRNKINVLQQRMQFAEICIPDLIEELEKYQRESERAVTGKAVVAIVAGNLFLAPCWGAKKNQDIEGS